MGIELSRMPMGRDLLRSDVHERSVRTGPIFPRGERIHE